MREWRRTAGLSTTEAGARLGLSRRTIEGIEQGRREGDELARIALEKLLEDAKYPSGRPANAQIMPTVCYTCQTQNERGKS